MNNFASFVTDKLRERGMKPSQLAHYSGVSSAEISRLLCGHRQPTVKTIRKIAPALKVAEEELYVAAGFIQSFPKPKTITIPIAGDCPAGKFDFSFSKVEETLEINWDLVKDKKAFVIKVKCDCLRDAGIFQGDFAIVSPQANLENGDIVIANIDGACAVKKLHKVDSKIILIPYNQEHEPIVLDSKQKSPIIGKVIRAIRNL